MYFTTVAEIALESILKISYIERDCEQWESGTLALHLGTFDVFWTLKDLEGLYWTMRYLISLASTSNQVFKVK